MGVQSPSYGPAGKPTVGRKVHFFQPRDEYPEPLSAELAAVDQKTGRCTLFVIDPVTESTYFVRNVPFSEEYGFELTWSWAPRV